MKNELNLPNLKSKPNQTFDEIKIKYNDIAMQGPESLRHNRRTMLQALKRMAASGEADKLHEVTGFTDPVKLIIPHNSDRRYRQYNEIKIPSSNAVIFFARDGSASMDEYKCDIVSDMCWWMDIWIRQFYKRVERCYIWHDTEAEEVDEHRFYRYRYGGGTSCSSSLKLIEKQLENRYPPDKWNIYIFYFTDGENFDDDNKVFNEIISKKFSPEIVNFVGITQILPWYYDGSLKQSVDIFTHKENVKTAGIGTANAANTSGYNRQLGEDERNKQIKDAIIHLLGNGVKRNENEEDDD